MSKPKISPKSPEFKRLFKDKARFWRELDSSRVTEAKLGYLLDEWGTYVPEVKANKLLDTLMQLAEIDNEDDSFAFRYSHAGVLSSLNKLDEAESEYKALLQERPNLNGPSTITAFLALIAAKRGNFDEARRLASVQNTSQCINDHVSEESLVDAYEKHMRLLERHAARMMSQVAEEPKDHRSVNDIQAGPCEKVAIQFANLLVAGEFGKANELLSKSVRSEWSGPAIRDSYEEMIAYFQRSPNFVDVIESLTEWPGKQAGDVGWVHMAIADDVDSEAITLIICEENGKHLINCIEWGRS